MPSSLPPLPTSCRTVKYLLIPWDTQLVTDLALGFVLCGDVHALYVAMFFSLSISRQKDLQKAQSISVFDLNRHSEQAEHFRERISPYFCLKQRDFQTLTFLRTWGFLIISWGFLEVQSWDAMLLFDMSVSVNEWLLNEPLRHQHYTKLTLFSYVNETRMLCGSWMCCLGLITNRKFLLFI